MGPLFVLMFWAIVAIVLSVIVGSIFSAVVAYLTRGVTAGRKRAISVAGFLPAAAFVYLFVCVMLFSVWSASRGRDWGWGDTWRTPILGHYNLMMIDVTDEGTIYNRDDKAVSDGDSVHSAIGRKDVLFGVRRLQIHDPYILGAASLERDTDDPSAAQETLFFVLDTRSNSRTDYGTFSDLGQAALNLRIPLQLEPVSAIYGRYRYTWLDFVAFALLLAPAAVVAAILLRALLRLRSNREAHA